MTTRLRGADAAGRLDVLMAVGEVAGGVRALADVLPELLDALVPGLADLCIVEDAEEIWLEFL